MSVCPWDSDTPPDCGPLDPCPVCGMLGTVTDDAGNLCHGYLKPTDRKPWKIYLAARFSDRPLMETVGDRLKAEGFKITSSWVFGGEDGLSYPDIAKLDLADVDKADTIVSFTHRRGTLLATGGGRHVEFGYALARGKRCVVIGERENVFHHHPDVEVYSTLDEWIAKNKR